MARVTKGKAHPSKWPVVGLTSLLLFGAVAATWAVAERPGLAAPVPQIAAQGTVAQFGSRVGWADGAKILPSKPSVVEFESITHGPSFISNAEFDYDGRKLRILQVWQLQYLESPQGDARQKAEKRTNLVRVQAQIQGGR